MTSTSSPESIRLLGFPLHALRWRNVDELFGAWLVGTKHKQVTVFNVHSLIVARRDSEFQKAIEASDLVLCDSMPLMWHAHAMGQKQIERIAGPDLCEALCRMAEANNHAVFFLGSTPAILGKMVSNLRKSYPRLQVVGTYSPPMKTVFSEQDNESMRQAINAQPVDILFVGLTAPKQEKWIFHNLIHLRCKLAIGIGAAFEFIAGTRTRAPVWIQRMGLEWFFRFGQEPRRLWKRYLISNSIFLFIAFREAAWIWTQWIFKKVGHRD